MRHKRRPLVSVDESHRTSDSAADSTGHDLSRQTVTMPDQEHYNLELIANAKSSIPEVDIVAIHDCYYRTQTVRRSVDLSDSATDDVDDRRQRSTFLEAEVRRSIAESRDGPFAYVEVSKKDEEVDATGLNQRINGELSEADSLASQVPQGHSFSADTTHATEQQEKIQDMEHPRKHRLSSVETRPLRKSSKVQNINWLPDAKMLQSDIPNSRIWAYSYHKSNDNPPRAEYLIDVAKNLVLQLFKQRRLEEYDKVPIIFVGLEFGCFVLQKMTVLLDSPDELEGKMEILRLVAGVLFIDAPAPTLGPLTYFSERDPKSMEYRPLDSNSVKEKDGPSINIPRLWKDFVDVAERSMISVVWFYFHMALLPFQHTRVVLFQKVQDKNQESPFSNRRDLNYQRLIDQVKRCLVFKSSRDNLLAENLRTFFERRDFPAGARDSQGQTPLHWAALKGNLDAVELLTRRIQDMAIVQDKTGQIPLHVAVIQASKIDNPTDDDQTNWRNVILELMKGQVNVDCKDKEGKSAWDYADDKKRKWIKILKNERAWISGLLIKLSPGAQDLPDKPKRARLSACRRIEAGLSEFYWDPYIGEILNFKDPTIFRLIYHKKERLEEIFSNSKPPGLKSRCRWIHLPANNEQWIHDLFIKLRIRDSSMAGRQEYARHMVPQARLYQHFREKSNEQKNGQGRADYPPNESYGLNIQSNNRDDTVLRIPEFETSKNLPQQNMPTDTALVVFMPILGFETHRHRKYLSRAIQGNSNSDDEGPSSLLLRGYMHDSKSENLKPIHCRRTLDQFSYYSLDSTERRDMDQVIYRWAKKWHGYIPAKDRPILMVDQLWLWLLNDGTVITSCSDTWNLNGPFSLASAVKEELKNRERPFIESAEDVAHMILRTSINFFKREGPTESKFQDCFVSSINDTSDAHDKLFKTFRGIIKKLSDPEIDQAERIKQMNRLLLLNEETEYMIEIMDIQDELGIVKSVLTQQQEVLDQMFSFYTKEDVSNALGNSHREPGTQFQGVDRSEKQSRKNERIFPLWNRHLMMQNISIVEKNIMIVQDVIKHSEHVKTELDTLLKLTEMQVNAWEVRIAREGSQETRKQGNTLLVFTLVTIIFLPLSFLSSFFALSIDSFPKDPESGNTSWPLNEVTGYLLGITAALSIFFVTLAFKASSIRSWLEKRTDKRRKREKRKRSSHVKRAEVYNAPEDSDEENSDRESKNRYEVFYSGFDTSGKYHGSLGSISTSSRRDSSIQSEHRARLGATGSEDSDMSKQSSIRLSYLDAYSSESPSDHDRETRTTKQNPPAELTSKASKRARATGLVNPMLRFVRRRRRARRTDIEAGESSSLSESDMDF